MGWHSTSAMWCNLGAQEWLQTGKDTHSSKNKANKTSSFSTCFHVVFPSEISEYCVWIMCQKKWNFYFDVTDCERSGMIPGGCLSRSLGPKDEPAHSIDDWWVLTEQHSPWSLPHPPACKQGRVTPHVRDPVLTLIMSLAFSVFGYREWTQAPQEQLPRFL